MYEYTCQNCGKTKKVHYPWEVRTYCSVKCSAKHREEEKRRVADAVIAGECIFQPESVMCDKRDCVNCGWNPVVAKARLDKLGYVPEQKTKPETEKFGVWVSVADKMPEDGVQVLAITTNGKCRSVHQKNGEWKCNNPQTITHWMPMPPEPEV